MRRLFALWALATTLVASACGTEIGPTTPVVKPPVDTTPKPPTIASVVVVGTTAMVVGESASVPRVEVTKSDGTKEYPSVQLSSTAPSVVIVTATAMKAVAPGTAQVTASYPGYTVTPLSVTVAPRPVTVIETAIRGDSVTEAPRKVQLRLIRKFSDGTEQELSATWSYPNPDYVFGEVSSTGLVTPHGIGIVHVYASYQGVQYNFQVRVVGTPWSRWLLPGLVKDLARSTVASDGTVWRWADGVTTVWHNSTIPHEEAVAGLEIIDSTAKANGTKFSYTFVADSASARVKITFEGPLTPKHDVAHCGSAESKMENYALVSGLIWIVPESRCITRLTIAHEVVHVFGINGHTSPGTDVLSAPDPATPNSPSSVWKMTPTLAQTIHWTLTVVLPGTIPVEP